MPHESPFHTDSPEYPPTHRNVYHDNSLCDHGKAIKQEHRVSGPGGRPRCDRCDALASKEHGRPVLRRNPRQPESHVTDVPAGHTPFALWNRSGNRLVAVLLRSPLHPLVSRRLALISVTGRRTGAQHTFPVGYQESNEELTIPVLWPERKLWWRNLRDGAAVRLRLRGADRTGQARARVDDRGGVTVEVLLDPRA